MGVIAGADVTGMNRPVRFPSGTIVGYLTAGLIEQISRTAVLPTGIQYGMPQHAVQTGHHVR